MRYRQAHEQAEAQRAVKHSVYFLCPIRSGTVRNPITGGVGSAVNPVIAYGAGYAAGTDAARYCEPSYKPVTGTSKRLEHRIRALPAPSGTE